MLPAAGIYSTAYVPWRYDVAPDLPAEPQGLDTIIAVLTSASCAVAWHGHACALWRPAEKQPEKDSGARLWSFPTGGTACRGICGSRSADAPAASSDVCCATREEWRVWRIVRGLSGPWPRCKRVAGPTAPSSGKRAFDDRLSSGRPWDPLVPSGRRGLGSVFGSYETWGDVLRKPLVAAVSLAGFRAERGGEIPDPPTTYNTSDNPRQQPLSLPSHRHNAVATE